MQDKQLLRYSRQIMLPEIDIVGQQKLADATAIIIGLGGLGSAASIYLAAAGVGHLILIDFDTVDLSNLQRQIVHSTKDIGRAKVTSAKEHLLALNPEIQITTIDKKLTAQELEEQIKSVSVLLDCSDNFATRFSINQACVAQKIPLVSAAAIRFEAQISVFNSQHQDSPCYRCLYSEAIEEPQNCTANGVLAPLLGIVGSIQACEAMKIIMQLGEPLEGKVLLLDVIAMEWHMTKLNKDIQCPVCGHL